MSRWIENAGGVFPPTCLSVLLYVVTLHEDCENLWDEACIAGFYDEEENKWAYDLIEDNQMTWKHFDESETLKVIAWTLPPEDFCFNKYKEERKQLGLNLFRN